MTLLFVAAIGSCSSQNVNLICSFQSLSTTLYVCNLNNIEVLNPTQTITFGGNHIGGRTNANVTAVIIRNSNTPFVIQQIFTTFANIDELEIESSQLQSVIIPETVLLRILQLNGNNITRLGSGLLQAQSQLQYFSAIDSNIREIDEDAFVGLARLRSLLLIGNLIEEIAPRTFHPLINLIYLDLEANNLRSIGEDLFSQNTGLNSIYLEWNRINEIAPRFLANLGNNLYFINLTGNVCVNRSFQIGNEENLIIINNLLRTCFNNFSGRTTDLRDLKAKFRGSLRVYDEFDNIIGSV